MSILFLVGTLPAQADAIRPLSQKVSAAQLSSACSQNGGNFSLHEDGGGYGCRKDNCDGKGGTCQIACTNDGVCHGQTPSRVTTINLNSILQNGGMAVRKNEPAR
ncbi:hypothetical protein CF98_33390 [Halopseudomonas bauzanensis]|nr:hypothetical protein CF98_33390 [Halopseudomonas bauzanensis]